MKSAYELAMERLAKGQPLVTLTDEQKKQLASEIKRLQEDCEAKKEKLRASFGK